MMKVEKEEEENVKMIRGWVFLIENDGKVEEEKYEEKSKNKRLIKCKKTREYNKGIKTKLKDCDINGNLKDVEKKNQKIMEKTIKGDEDKDDGKKDELNETFSERKVIKEDEILLNQLKLHQKRLKSSKNIKKENKTKKTMKEEDLNRGKKTKISSTFKIISNSKQKNWWW